MASTERVMSCHGIQPILRRVPPVFRDAGRVKGLSGKGVGGGGTLRGTNAQKGLIHLTREGDPADSPEDALKNRPRLLRVFRRALPSIEFRLPLSAPSKSRTRIPVALAGAGADGPTSFRRPRPI